MNVMWLTDSEAEMENSKFRDELLFQASMNIAGRMLENGMISEEEYRKIRNAFIEKYSPVIGTLLSEIKLT